MFDRRQNAEDECNRIFKCKTRQQQNNVKFNWKTWCSVDDKNDFCSMKTLSFRYSKFDETLIIIILNFQAHPNHSFKIYNYRLQKNEICHFIECPSHQVAHIKEEKKNICRSCNCVTFKLRLFIILIYLFPLNFISVTSQ